MKMGEKERLILVGKKEEIQMETASILTMADDPGKAVEIRKKITRALSSLAKRVQQNLGPRF